jgi:phosphatidate cytidylyltransferase
LPVPFTPTTANNKPQAKPSRVKVGLIIGFVVLLATFYGSWAWVALVVFGCYFSYLELDQLMQAKNIRPSRLIVGGSGLVLLTFAVLHKTQYFSSIIAATAIASFIRLLFRKPVATISDIGATLTAVFYTVYLPLHFILLRDLGAEQHANPLNEPGLWYLLYTLLVLSSNDIAAYYAGKKFGKHLLYPEISPKKTKEGSVVGCLTGIVVGITVGGLVGLGWLHGLLLSVLLVITGQLGDLSESLLKRDAGLKDSGAMLAGHGGLMDRIDSYVFSGAVSFYYIHWVVLHQGLAEDIMKWIALFSPAIKPALVGH